MSSFMPDNIPDMGVRVCKSLETYQYNFAGKSSQNGTHCCAYQGSGWTRSCSYDGSSAIGLNATSNRLFQTETKHNLDVYHYDEKSTGSGCTASVSGFTWDFIDRLRSSSTQIMKNGTAGKLLDTYQ
ncbi:hypothetical protein WAI453_003074 [Rhynchosporium graminicola]|uniref:Uncharacterized protein n=1 Tax=Rhynchosporium graminicola TaxID=2792576 RepID=A0A1E1LJ68_9HELO|nr:uncharacterized protein RCO7_15078 [Rhynchosporium commune]